MNPRWAVVLIAAAWAGACSDGPGPLGLTTVTLPAGPVVSDPTAAPATNDRVSAAIVLDDDVAYASLIPNTVAEGATATVRSLVAGATVLVSIRDGGFDPVPVAAGVGDTIEIIVRDAAGAVVYQVLTPVVAIRAPIVVRGYPPARKRDVPLNTAVVVVFSEPVDAATLSTSSIRLLRGSGRVAGTVGLLAGTTTAAVFTPAALLRPNTDYRLVVTQAVKDLDGDALVTSVAVDFRTGTIAAGPPSLVTVSPETATVPIGQQVQLTADSRDTFALPIYGRPVTWSTGNPSVATVSATGLVTPVGGGQAVIRAEVGGQGGVARVIVRTDVGHIRVTTVTTGVDFPSDYDLFVDDGPPFVIGPNETKTTPDVFAGAHAIELKGIPINCQPSGLNPDTVQVRAHDTTVVTFTVFCQRAERIAFAYATSTWNPDCDESGCWETFWTVAVMGEDGSSIQHVALGAEPAWSPDGTRIAFSCYATGEPRICVVSPGGAEVALQRGYSPTWSPDGSKIAYVAQDATGLTQVYVMNADGTGVVPLTSGTGRFSPNSTGFAAQPAWSPDGARIAFDCVADTDNWDICVVNADGTGLVRITSDPGIEGGAAWSPDGARIAFATQRWGETEIALMHADGTAVARLTHDPGYDLEPAWSPDGSKIAFQTLDGGNWVIYIVAADGTGRSRVGYGAGPAWKPTPPIPK